MFPLEMQGAQLGNQGKMLANQQTEMSIKREQALIQGLSQLKDTGDRLDNMDQVADVALSTGNLDLAGKLLGKSAQTRRAMAETIRAYSTANKDDVAAKYAPFLAQSLIDARKSQAATNATRRKYYSALADRAKVQADKLGKTGAVKIPQKAELDAAKKLIMQTYPKILDDPNGALMIGIGADTIASEAEALRTQNTSLGMEEAVKQAFLNSVKRGDWQHGGGNNIMDGATPQTALSMPKTAKDAQVNKYYVNSNGVIGIWTGEEMLPLTEGRVGGAPADDDTEGLRPDEVDDTSLDEEDQKLSDEE